MAIPHMLRMLLAGILSLPALAVLILAAPLIGLLSFPSLAILTRRKSSFTSSFSRSRLATKPSESSGNNSSDAPHPLLHHAVITGGSSGIGLAVAIELAKRKCKHITLIARREEQLKEAQRLVQEVANDVSDATRSTVHILSVDVTDFESLQKKAAQLCGTDDATNNNAPSDEHNNDVYPGVSPTLLFNCAGYSIPLAFNDLSPSDFKAQMHVNYMGSIHTVKAFLPYMLTSSAQQPNNGIIGGNIILTSSMSGQVGSYGYSAYSPTKFALRGFAESLSMELSAIARSGPQVNVSLCYPPDTNTPGYEIENKAKPEACRLISESGGIWDAQIVGKKIVKEALSPNPSFDIYFGLEGWMLSTITAGMNPVTGILDALSQVALMGLLRFVSLFYLMDFGRITQNCHEKQQNDDCDEFKTD